MASSSRWSDLSGSTSNVTETTPNPLLQGCKKEERMILGCKSRARRRTRSCFVEIATGFLGVGIAAVMLPLRSSSLIARLSGRRNVLALRLKFFPNHCSGSRHRVSLTDFRYRAAAFPWSIAPPKGTALRSTSSLNSETSSASSTTPDDTISNAGFSTDGLNPSQLSAVTHPVDSLVRVISGPGSGKTRVLTSRIVHLLTLEDDWRRREGWDGMSHNRRGGILAVTFTRKAAGEMQERIQSMVQGNQRLLSRVTLGTFHSICAKILRWNGGLINSLPVVQREALSLSANGTTVSNNLNGNFVIIDDGEQSRILRGCMEEAGVSIKDSTVRLGAIQSTMNEYKEALSQGNSQPFGNSGKGLKGLSMVQQMALTLYPLYREHMLSHNCVDFDDLIYYCRDLLLNHVDVRERLQSKWTHVLVDEFQDTSKSQLDLVKLWTSNSLMVVGDADQSIYSWRGAHAGSLSDFDKEFQSWGNVSTVFLMENYRSTSNIIMAAQKVISHRSHFEEATGAVKLRRNMKPKRGKGPPPRIIRFKDSDEEARFVVTTVKDARAVGNYSIDHTVAFIYRTNAQSRALEEACVQANLPYVIYGSATSFYKRLEIKDCLCYLRWLANGNDGIAMIRALTTPKRGIGDSTIQEFENYSAELISRRASEGIIATPLDALVSITNDSSQDYPQPRDFLSSRSVKVLTEFARSMKNLRTLAHREPLETVLKFVVDAMGLVPYLDKASKTAAEFEERLQNIRELQQATRRYTVHGPALGTDITPATGGEEGFLESPLSSFLDDVALVTDLADRSAEERFVVNLMTIHASKGKEFDTVFVVGNEDGTFPTSQAIMEGEGSVKLEEEKRLCYVAMTRAKTELFLTWRQLVNVFTTQGIRQENRGRSRFLDVLVGDKGKVTKSDRSDSSLSKSSTEPYSLDSRRKYSTGSALSRSYTSDRRSAGGDLGSSSSTASRNPPRYGQWKKPGSVVVPPEPSRREGTTSVYGRSSRPMTKPLQERRANTAPIAPLPRRTSSAFVSSSSSSYVSPRPPTSSSPPRRVASSPGRQHRSRYTKIDEWAKPIPVDGNLFYPVGSDVIHKAFGKGVVQPRPPNESDPMMVHVKFLSGRQDRFSARGNDLLPDLLS